METKPYNIQSPEQIAKDYGGNKQKIAEAMQMGIVDPTAGTLAGMFIDRMRSAAQAEQAPQQTIAQKTFAPPAPPMGGIGVPSPMPQPGAPAGLGATPEAAQMPQMPMAEMPAPEMPMAEMPAAEMPEMDMPEEEPSMDMAEGGLTTLPLPDTMFDEPDNGGYADGGIVAFAGGGGMSNLYKDVEYWESGGNQGAVSKAGARGVMQLMPGTMKDPGFGVPSMAELRAKGLSEEEANRLSGQKYLDAMYRRYGDQPTALAAYNWGPGNVDKWLEKGGDPKKLPAETKKYITNIMKGDTPPIRERNTRTAEGFTSNLGDITDYVERRFGKTEEEKANDEAIMARAKEMASPEYAAKEAKNSLWGTLAAVGFKAAGSKAASLAEAFGEAAAAEIGNYVTDAKERKQLKDKALNLMVANGAKNRKDAMDRFDTALKIQQLQLSEKLSGQKLDLDERQVKAAEDKLAFEIATAKAAGEDVNDRVTRYLLDFAPGSPEHEAARRVFDAKRPPASTSGAPSLEQIRGNVQAGRTGGTAEGTTAKDSDGKTIVFSNGQWMYP